MSSTLSFHPTQSPFKSLPYFGHNISSMSQLGLPRKPTLRQRLVCRVFLGQDLGIWHLWKKREGSKIGWREKLDRSAVSVDISDKPLGNSEDGLTSQHCLWAERAKPHCPFIISRWMQLPQEGGMTSPEASFPIWDNPEGLTTEGTAWSTRGSWGCENCSPEIGLPGPPPWANRMGLAGFIYSFRKHLWHRLNGQGADLWWPIM